MSNRRSSKLDLSVVSGFYETAEYFAAMRDMFYVAAFSTAFLFGVVALLLIVSRGLVSGAVFAFFAACVPPFIFSRGGWTTMSTPRLAIGLYPDT